MKVKNLYLLASVAFLSFASCTDDMQELDPQQELKQIVMTMQDFEPEAGSRTLYQIADGAVQCTWAANDTVGVFPDEGAQAYFPMASGAGAKNATFDGGGWALKDGSTYAAYYPSIGDFYLDKHAVPVDYTGQIQNGDASVAHLGAYDYMAAVPTESQNGCAQFTFEHMGALVQLELTIPQPTALTSINLVTENETFVVKGKVDIMTDTLNIRPVTYAQNIGLDLKDIVTTEENQVVTLYMMIPPTDLSAQTLKAVITSEKGVWEIDLESKNFEAGIAYALLGTLKDDENISNGTYKDGVVNLVNPGVLKELIGTDYLNISSLKIVGPINGDDVNALRQMFGYSSKKLITLDLSEARIVEGGKCYYEDSSSKQYYTSKDVIGDYMFYGCSKLYQIVLPMDITAIGNYAFSGSGLLSIEIPDKVTSIGDCAFFGRSLNSIEIPDNVISIGDNAFSNCSYLSSVTIGDGVQVIGEKAFNQCLNLRTVTLGKGVRTIGNYAFYNCQLLKSIEIPDNVTTIGVEAFFRCKSMDSMTIGKGVVTIGDYAFWQCEALKSVEIPDNVTTIGNGAFAACSRMVIAGIGNGVRTIGEGAFGGCALKSVNIPNNVITIGDDAFRGCDALESIEIPDCVILIGTSAFQECGSLSSVTIGDGDTRIGNLAFNDCDRLTSVVMGNGAITIGDYAFSDCDALTSIDIPDGVIRIGRNAFYRCGALISVSIGDGVRTIGDEAFYECYELTSVAIGRGVTTIGSKAFDYCDNITSVYITDLSAWCNIKFNDVTSNPLCNYLSGDNITSLYLNDKKQMKMVIPEDVTEIREYAFYGCDSLVELIIGNNVTKICTSAFTACNALKDVTIGDGVTTIEEDAFRGCISLKSVSIGKSITKIGDHVFWGCKKISEFSCYAMTPPCTSKYSFDSDGKKGTLYVPSGCSSNYKIWSGLFYIEEMQ